MTLMKELLTATESAKRVILANLADSAERTGTVNPYGDKTLILDKMAEDVIIEVLESSDTPLMILSEERGLMKCRETPEYLTIIDPIDGSANLERGIPLCSIGISVIPHSEKMTTDDVEISIIKSIFSEETYVAEKERGVKRNNRAVSVADYVTLDQTIISYDTKMKWDSSFTRSSVNILSAVHDMRRTASNLLDLCWVAAGGLDAIVDLRGLLPIVHVSGTHMVTEAGGYVLSDDGTRLNLPIEPSQMMSFVAASNQATAEEILNLFQTK